VNWSSLSPNRSRCFSNAPDGCRFRRISTTRATRRRSGIKRSLRANPEAIAEITLDVGIGTFRPMKSARLDEHVMHAERYAIAPDAVAAIEGARASGGRVVAAGTTVVRALEGNAAAHGQLVAEEGATDLFIKPGFRFKLVDAMITNFHLPQSTLLVLVSAFAGRERILAAYREAVKERYRFFSFGDAMWIEP